jgi:DNA-binding response OmpR family regulator
VDTVVVVSDRERGVHDVSARLSRAGWRVVARKLSDDPDEIALETPDLVVLDIPDDRRVRPTVAAVTRAHGMDGVPVIAVVGAPGVGEAGIDPDLADFVARPLRDEELEARVRRPFLLNGRSADDRVRVGRLVIDLKGYEASADGTLLDLTYQEFELLKFLATHPGQAFSRDQLLARVWGYDYYGGSRTVDIHVRRIRAKLGHPLAGCLQTVRHVGYKWVPQDFEKVPE